MNVQLIPTRTNNGQEKSFADLVRMYEEHRKNLVALDFEFLINFGQALLREGRIRKAIEITREALSYTDDRVDRAFVYLSLCRMYRMMTLMKNARAELRRAFKELGVEYPRSGFPPFFWSIIGLFFTKAYSKTGGRAPKETLKMQLKVALYEEAGLSTYYLRGSNLLMLQISFRAKKIAAELGPSLEMINWLGATGTLLAIINQRAFSEILLSRGDKIAKDLSLQYPQAKQQMWRALSADYLRKPQMSVRIFEQIISDYKNIVTMSDLRLICITMSCNYVIRGHTALASRAIEQLFTEYDKDCTEIFSCNKTFIEWYKIPSLSFGGETKKIEQILRNSRAIFASVDEEKWQITHYLGNVLIYYYLANQHDFEEVSNIFNRFNALRLSPERTFLEGGHYWVAKTYLLFELFYQDKANIPDIVKAISDLSRVQKHPSIQSHYFVLKAHMALIQGDYSSVRKNVEVAREIAAGIDNVWAECEADKIIMMLSYKERKITEAKEQFEGLQQKVKHLGWMGYQVQLEKYQNRYL